MACASNSFRDPSELLELILRIPTALWSIQAWLGIPDAIGLFSPPDLPFCQLFELGTLMVIHGLRILAYPSFKFNWIKGRVPGPSERNRYWLASAGFTVGIWIYAIIVRLVSHAPGPRNDTDVLVLHLPGSIFRVGRLFIGQLNQSPIFRLVYLDSITINQTQQGHKWGHRIHHFRQYLPTLPTYLPIYLLWQLRSNNLST